MADNPRIGSSLDEFLDDEGLLPDVSATAMKRVIAWRIADAMKRQGLSKSAMAEREGMCSEDTTNFCVEGKQVR